MGVGVFMVGIVVGVASMLVRGWFRLWSFRQ